MLDASSSAPVLGLPLEERAHGPEIALVPQKVGLLLAVGPEADGVGERVHGLVVAADEGAAKVDVLDLVLFGLEVGDLANVVTIKVSSA